MANRRPLVLNSAGYQEYFQSADTLQVDGSVSINGTSFDSNAPLIITGAGQTNLNQSAIVGLFAADEITVDSDTTDNISITLGSNGNITASGRVNASSVDINSSTVINGVLDEDGLNSNSATKLATQQSIKAYVDAITKTVRFAADSGSGDFEAGVTTDVLTIAGTTGEIVTSASGDTITLGLPTNVVITNLNLGNLSFSSSPEIVSSILDEDDFFSNSATALATQQSIKVYTDNYTDTQIAAIPNASSTVRGMMTAADKVKIDGIEANATRDQTGAEIKALYEVEANAYTDTKDTKLAGIETGATADQTAAEIRVLVNAANNSNVFTDANKSKLAGIESGATADQTASEIKALYETEPAAFTDAQFTKLQGIETGATADQTGSEIKALYEVQANAYTDAKNTKLAGIENGATADQTDAEIRAAVASATNSNVFTDADHTKLDGIEAGAEVNIPHNLSYQASTRTVKITNGTNTVLPEVTTSTAGLASGADKTKLDGIETGATADQTASEIRALVENASNSNVFTDADHTKLNGIEAGAEVNLPHNLSYQASNRRVSITNGTNITLPHAVNGGNSGLLRGSDQTQLDSLATDLAGKADLVNGKLDPSQVPDLAISEFLGSVNSVNALTTLSGQTGDWAIVTGSGTGTVYIITSGNGSSSSNWTAFAYPATVANLGYNAATRTVTSTGGTDAVLTEVVSGGNSGLMTGSQASKLSGIESGATGDQTAAEIRTLVENANNSNVFTDADHTKLNGIAAGAEVNVDTNITYNANTRKILSSTGTDAVLPHVVASGNSGLISGTDKAKLDGIEDGATADQTKADIDALNINADKLDGQHGSFYRNAGSINAGTLSTSRLPNPIQLSGNNAFIKLQETDVTNTPTWWTGVDGGNYSIRLNNTGVYPLSISTNANNNSVTGIALGYATTISSDGNNLNLRSKTNGTPVGISFSSDVPASQQGAITYTHVDTASYGSNEAFILNGNQNDITVLADGKLMYKTGIYSKPASGTGAGTRKDNLWDTAYGWGDHSAAGYEDASNLTSGTIPDARISDIGNSAARIITFDNLEKSNLTVDGQLGFDSSQGLLVHRTQQGTTGATTTVLDGWNVTAGTGISISNLGSGGTGTEEFIFSLGNHSANLLTSGTVAAARLPNHSAGLLTSGTLDAARLPEHSTDLLTSGTLDAARLPNHSAALLTSGTLPAARLPNHSAALLTSGTLPAARLPNHSAALLTSGTLPAARLPNHSANLLNSGTVNKSRLPGTMNGTTFDSGTSTTVSVKCDNGGNAIVRAGGDGQGTGVFEVTQDNGSHGGGMSYNGDGSPSFVDGETADHVAFYRIDAGTRTEVFHYPYNSSVVNFNSVPTVGGTSLVRTSDTIASATNASTLGGASASVSASNNTIVKRHSSGYIFANYFNTTPNTVSANVTKVCVETGDDGYIRHGDAASIRSFINVANGATNNGSGNVSDRLAKTGGTMTGELQLNARLDVGDGNGNDHEIRIRKKDNNTSDHIQFYNGTTRMGEIGCHDTTWLRINQVTNKPIYTPRYIRADGGFFVDGTGKGIDTSGNFVGGTIAGASDYNTLLRANSNDTATGQITLQRDSTADDDFSLHIRNAQSARAQVKFSNNATDQNGFLFYRHEDAESNSAANSFHFSSDQTSTAVIIDQTAGNSGFWVGANKVPHVGEAYTQTGAVTFNGKINIRGHADWADNEYAYFGSSDDWQVHRNDNNWTYINDKGNGIIFQDNGTNKMRLEDSGVFRPETDGTGSIGKNDVRWANGYFDALKCTGTLEVRGAIDLADNDILRLGSGDDAELFTNGSHLYLDLNSGIGNFYIRDGTTTKYTFNDNGSFTATGDVTAYSDITLKRDIKLIPNALDKVCELRGVTYDRIDLEGEDNQRQSGVIAQEVEKVLPEVVRTDDEGIKSVAYGNMVGLLIESIKELKAEIETLKAERN